MKKTLKELIDERIELKKQIEENKKERDNLVLRLLFIIFVFGVVIGLFLASLIWV